MHSIQLRPQANAPDIATVLAFAYSKIESSYGLL